MDSSDLVESGTYQVVYSITSTSFPSLDTSDTVDLNVTGDCNGVTITKNENAGFTTLEKNYRFNA